MVIEEKKKKNRNGTLMGEQEKYLKEHLGFLLSKRFAEHKQNQEGLVSYFMEDLPWWATQSYFMENCHRCGAKLPHETSCVTLLSQGPKPVHYCKNVNWDSGIEAIYIGTSNNVYIPENLGTKLANLSHTEAGIDYVIGLNGTTHETSRFQSWLVQRVTVIGLQKTIPILIEFSKSVGQPEKGIDQHLTSFARVIHHVQKMYNGPIIILHFPPPLPIVEESSYNYISRVGRFYNSHVILKTIENIFGIPVYVMDMMESIQQKTQWYRRKQGWNSEPLFKQPFGLCREYFARMELELKSLLQILKRGNY